MCEKPHGTSARATDADHVEDAGDDPEVPERVVSEAARLTRLSAVAAVEAESEVYRERRAATTDPHDVDRRSRKKRVVTPATSVWNATSARRLTNPISASIPSVRAPGICPYRPTRTTG